MNTVSRPFKGAVVCFTGVQDKVGRSSSRQSLSRLGCRDCFADLSAVILTLSRLSRRWPRSSARSSSRI